MAKLRVGIIGVNAERGWASEAHVPAVRALDGLELAAVATRGEESAKAAGAAFGVAPAYGDPTDLIADPDIDLVTVAASVPAHHDLILAALEAGKHVLTEWPVVVSTAQTERIAAVAERSGRHVAVGLQARVNPAAVRAVELVTSGAIGRVLTATVLSTTAGSGRTVSEGELYLEDPATAMNLMTIQLAHTVDVAAMVAGALTSLAALTTIQYPDLRVGDSARPHRRTIADHVLLHARLAEGGALAMQVAGGRPAGDTPFQMEVLGEDGVLTLTGGAARGFQSGVLQLALNGAPVEVIDPETASLPDSVVNVARMYAALRDDITHATSSAPDFDHALHLSGLIDDTLAAAANGRTTTPTTAWTRPGPAESTTTPAAASLSSPADH